MEYAHGTVEVHATLQIESGGRYPEWNVKSSVSGKFPDQHTESVMVDLNLKANNCELGPPCPGWKMVRTITQVSNEVPLAQAAASPALDGDPVVPAVRADAAPAFIEELNVAFMTPVAASAHGGQENAAVPSVSDSASSAISTVPTEPLTPAAASANSTNVETKKAADASPTSSASTFESIMSLFESGALQVPANFRVGGVKNLCVPTDTTTWAKGVSDRAAFANYLALPEGRHPHVKYLFPYSVGPMVPNAGALVERRSMVKLAMNLCFFNRIIEVQAIILNGVVDGKAFESINGIPRGLSDERNSGGVVVGQNRRLQNGWAVTIEMVLSVTEARDTPFNTLVVVFCFDKNAALLVSLASVMPLSKEKFMDFEAIPVPAPEESMRMTLACVKALSEPGALSDSNVGKCLDTPSMWQGGQNFFAFHDDTKPGRNKKKVEEQEPSNAEPVAQTKKMMASKNPDPNSSSVVSFQKSARKSDSLQDEQAEFKNPKKGKRASYGASLALGCQSALMCSASTVAREKETYFPPAVPSFSDAIEIAVLKTKLGFAEEKLGLQAEAAKSLVEAAKMKEGVHRLEESRAREDILQEKFSDAKSLATAQTLSALQEAQSKAFAFALAFKDGSSTTPALTPKEAAFRSLLEKADCEEKFQVLWENSIRSATSVLLLETQTIVDLGMTPVQVEILKKVAKSS